MRGSEKEGAHGAREEGGGTPHGRPFGGGVVGKRNKRGRVDIHYFGVNARSRSMRARASGSGTQPSSPSTHRPQQRGVTKISRAQTDLDELDGTYIL
jgi:hypothetical protein